MSTPTSTGTTKKAAAPRRPASGPAGTSATGSAAKGAPTPTRKTMEQHLETLAAGEVMSPEELYDFLESLRALSQGLAFFAHAGAAQLHAAARKASRDRTEDGRMTMVQKTKLKALLVRMGRQLNSGSAEALLSSATGAVKTWALMEDFLDSLESESVSKPHKGRGGFDPFGGR
jgi:hypothetical protein